MQPLDLVPGGIEQVGVDLVGRQLVEGMALDVVEDQSRRAVVERAQRGHRRTGHPGPPGQHGQQRLMLDRRLHRGWRRAVTGSPQHRQPVGPVQQVAVPAVLAVDLDEGPAAFGGGHVEELGSPARCPHQHQTAHVEAGLAEGGLDGPQIRASVGGAERQQHGGPHEGTEDGGHGQRRATGAARHQHHQQQHGDGHVGGLAPGPTEPGLAHGHGRHGAGQDGQRGEPGREQPGVPGDRPRRAGGELEELVEPQGGHRSQRGGQDQRPQPPPPLLHDQPQGDGHRHDDGDHLAERQRRLADLVRRPGRRPSQIVGPAPTGGRRQPDHQHQHRQHGPEQHEPHHVARMAEVAIAGRAAVQHRRLVVGARRPDRGR